MRVWMGLVVDLAQVMDTDLGINLGRVQPAVSEHLLDAPQVGPVLHHVCSCAATGDRLLSSGYLRPSSSG